MKIITILILCVSLLFEGLSQESVNNEDVYVGEQKDGLKHGHGTLKFFNGDTYTGNFLNDKFDGKGVLIYANGEKYEGEFKNDKFNGKGILEYVNGDRYEGEFKNDKFDGKGILVYANGEKYEGEFKNDKFNGKGILEYVNGDRYEGEWANGIKEGNGTLIYSNGEKYEGEFISDKFQGQGTYIYSNGSNYSGEWQNGLRNGEGTLKLTNGDIYVGEWNNDIQHGEGTLTLKNGDKYVGEWKNGKQNGYGVENLSDGSVYVGHFNDGIRDGYGKTVQIIQSDERTKINISYYVFELDKNIKHGKYLYTKNGFIQANGNFINGKKDGAWIYKPDYGWRIKGVYKTGLEEGEWEYKFKKYKLAVLNYKNGLFEGKQIGYHLNGRICVEKNYLAGIKEGVEKHFYKNGKVKEIKNYSNGDLHGVCSLFTKEGELISTIEYFYGTPINYDTKIDVSSNVKLKKDVVKYYTGNLKNGNGQLKVMALDPNSNNYNIYLKCIVKDSLLNGELVDYWGDIEKRIIGNFKDGYRVDKWQLYDHEGNLVSEKEYLYSQKIKIDTSFEASIDFEPFSQYNKFILMNPYNDYFFITPETYQYNYPRKCKTDSIEGTVIMTFLLNKYGDMENLNVVKSIDPLLDKEAMNIVRKNRYRAPVFCEGIPTSIKYAIFVNFSLLPEKEETFKY